MWMMARRRLLIGLILLLMAGVAAFIPLSASPVIPQERTIHVEASQYAYTPSEIFANPGDRITIELTSLDVVHGLYVDGYDLSLIADPGKTERLTFTANHAGSFRLRCNVTCGAMHPFMIGKLTIGQNTLLWRGIALAIIALVTSVVMLGIPMNQANYRRVF